MTKLLYNHNTVWPTTRCVLAKQNTVIGPYTRPVFGSFDATAAAAAVAAVTVVAVSMWPLTLLPTNDIRTLSLLPFSFALFSLFVFVCAIDLHYASLTQSHAWPFLRLVLISYHTHLLCDHLTALRSHSHPFTHTHSLTRTARSFWRGSVWHEVEYRGSRKTGAPLPLIIISLSSFLNPDFF